MSVMGIDFGNDKCVVAVARRGVIDVLQNEQGNRKTSSLVAYGSKNRLIGDAAVTQLINNYKNTVPFVKRFLGRPFDDPELKEELIHQPVPVVKLPNGGVGFQVSYNDEQVTLSAEQVAAALLVKLRQVAEKGLEGVKVRDCVISCPPFWHEGQRRALLDAAAIADLNVLRISNDTTAVALNYGILRPLPEKEPIRVAFVDVGVSCTNVAVVSFIAGKLQVLGVGFDRNLGGRSFDKAIFDHIAKNIKDKYKQDVNTDRKAFVKLLRESSRIKTVLSANQKVPYNLEYFMNGIDVSGVIERQEFEDLVKPLLERMTIPCQQALSMAGVKLADLHSVEIVGGATRIPIVQKALKDFFQVELSKTCDGDESVARGCTLMCAMLSPNFRVREFDVQDITPYPIELCWGPIAKDRSQPPQVEDKTPLIKAGNPLPSIKLISFKDRYEPFELIARYQDAANLPGAFSPVISRFVVSGMPTKEQAAKNTEQKNPKLKVKVKLDLNSLLSVTSAQLLSEVTVEEKAAPAAAAATPAAGAATSSEASMDTDAAKAAADAPSSAPMDEENAQGKENMDTEAPAAAGSAAPNSAAAAAPAGDKPKTLVKTVKLDLGVEQVLVHGYTRKDLDLAFEREVGMMSQDQLVADTNARKNELEDYVLNMKNNIQGELRDFIDQAIVPKFMDELNKTEDWLYDEGSDCAKNEYVKRINALKEHGDPPKRRKYEYDNRNEYIAALKSTIGRVQGAATSTDEKYAHIDQKEKEKLVQECALVDNWLAEKLTKQDKQALFLDPVFTCRELEDKKKALETMANTTLNKPKPEPPKPEPPKQDAPKQDAPKQDAPKQDSKQEAPKQDDKQEAPKQDAPKQDAPKQEAPKQEAPKQDAPKQDAPKEAPKQEAPKADKSSKK